MCAVCSMHFHVQITIREIYENQPNTKWLWNRWRVNNINVIFSSYISRFPFEYRIPYNIMICEVFCYFSASFIIFSFMSHSIGRSQSKSRYQFYGKAEKKNQAKSPNEIILNFWSGKNVSSASPTAPKDTYGKKTIFSLCAIG